MDFLDMMGDALRRMRLRTELGIAAAVTGSVVALVVALGAASARHHAPRVVEYSHHMDLNDVTYYTDCNPACVVINMRRDGR